MAAQRFKKGELIRYRTWAPGCTFVQATVETVYELGPWKMLRLQNGVVIAAQDCEPASSDFPS